MLMGLFTPTSIHYNCYSWDTLVITILLNSQLLFFFPAANIDSLNIFHHHFPVVCSAVMNDCFDITGTPRIPMDFLRWLKPLPVAICSHTAATLQLQYFLLDRISTLDDVAKEIFSPKPLHLYASIWMPYHTELPLLSVLCHQVVGILLCYGKTDMQLHEQLILLGTHLISPYWSCNCLLLQDGGCLQHQHHGFAADC